MANWRDIVRWEAERHARRIGTLADVTLPREDAEQEAWLALLRLDSSAPGQVVRWRARRAIQSAFRSPRYGGTRGHGWNRAAFMQVPRVDPWPAVDRRVTLDWMFRALTTRQRFLLVLLLDGYTGRETAELAGVTESAVSHLRAEAIERMRRNA